MFVTPLARCLTLTHQARRQGAVYVQQGRGLLCAAFRRLLGGSSSFMPRHWRRHQHLHLLVDFGGVVVEMAAYGRGFVHPARAQLLSSLTRAVRCTYYAWPSWWAIVRRAVHLYQAAGHIVGVEWMVV